MEDESILKLFFAREEAAIKEINEKYGHYCFSIANSILQSREDSEECVEDTWLSVWNAIPPERPSILKAYVAKITRNISINKFKLRKAKKRCCGEPALALEELSECIPSRDKTEQVSEDNELEKAISTFIGRIMARERGIFIRRYWFVEPVKAIAARYKISEGAVKLSLYRTRKKLKTYLEKEGVVI